MNKSEATLTDTITQARHLLQRNLFWEATELLSEYGRHHDLNGEAWNILGIAWSMLEEYAKARDAFESAIQNQPKTVDIHYNYAMLLRRMELFEEAMEEVNVALFLNAKHTPSLNLHRLLLTLLQDKRMHTTSNFQTLSRDVEPSPAWYGLICQFCGMNNPNNARVCNNCGTVINDAPPIIPAE